MKFQKINAKTFFLPLLFLATMLLLAWFFSHSLNFGIDSTKYRLAAQFYAENGFSLHHLDPYTPGFAKFYPVLISPFFKFFDIQTAIRLTRSFNTILFLSTIVPIGLSAQLVISRRLYSWLAAFFGVCTPWVILSGSLMTESLAFFLFGWAMYFILRSALDCKWYFDLGAICFIVLCGLTRIQLFVLLPIYFFIVLTVAFPKLWNRSRKKKSFSRALPFLQAILTVYPVTIVIAIFLAGEILSSRTKQKFDQLSGPYQEIRSRTQFPQDIFLGFGFEIAALAFGAGLCSALIGCSWYAQTLRQRKYSERKFQFAFITVITVIGMAIPTMIAQGGYLGAFSEERYYFYAVPFLWLGTFLALEYKDARTLVTPALVTGVTVVLSAGLVDLVIEPIPDRLILAPCALLLSHLVPKASTYVAEVIGLQGQLFSLKDTLAYAAIIVMISVGVALHRSKRMIKAVIWIGGSLQLIIVILMLLTYAGHIKGITANTRSYQQLERLSWVDRSLPKDKKAAWLLNQTDGRDWQQTTTFFWNMNISSGITGPAFAPFWFSYPVSAGLPTFGLQPENTGIPTEVQPDFVIQGSDSPYFQVATKRVLQKAEADPLELAEVDKPLRFVWTTQGLDPAGLITTGKPVTFTVPMASKNHSFSLKTTVTNTSSVQLVLSVQLASFRKQFQIAPSASREVEFSVCTKQEGKIETLLPPSSQVSSEPPTQTLSLKLNSVHLRQTKNTCSH